jgi:hypothetical protein
MNYYSLLTACLNQTKTGKKVKEDLLLSHKTRYDSLHKTWKKLVEMYNTQGDTLRQTKERMESLQENLKSEETLNRIAIDYLQTSLNDLQESNRRLEDELVQLRYLFDKKITITNSPLSTSEASQIRVTIIDKELDFKL